QIDPAARPDLGEILRRLGDEAPADAGGDAEVFVGRARELALLHEAFARSRAGRAQVVLIDGPAGVGESALASHLPATPRRPGGGGARQPALRARVVPVPRGRRDARGAQPLPGTAAQRRGGRAAAARRAAHGAGVSVAAAAAPLARARPDGGGRAARAAPA